MAPPRPENKQNLKN